MKNVLISAWNYIHTHFSVSKIIVVGFVFVMLFVDENSMVKRHEYNLKIRQLKKEISFYQQTIKESTQRLEELNSNKENLEKFAREQYLMKKDEEDIYLIEK